MVLGILTFKTNKKDISFKIKGNGSISVELDNEIKSYDLKNEDDILIEYTFKEDITPHNVQIKNAAEITEIDISSNQIESVNIEQCVKLKKFVAHNNDIETLNFTNCDTLQFVHIQNNPICTDKTKMTDMINTLTDRNNRSFGSVVMYDFVPPRLFDDMTEDQKSIRQLRKELEKTSIQKDWYFGSAITYDEVEKNKVPAHSLISNVVDIWESAEYGEGLIFSSIFEIYVPDTTIEWDKSVFLEKFDLDYSNNDIITSKQTDDTVSYDTGHGTSSMSMLLAKGNKMYGIIPKAKCIPIMRGNDNTGNINGSLSKKILNKLNGFERLDFIVQTATLPQSFDIVKDEVLQLLKNKKVLWFESSGNHDDGDLSTTDKNNHTPYAELVSATDHEGEILYNPFDKENALPSFSNENIKFSHCFYNKALVESGNVLNFGTSYSAPITAGVYGLLKILYTKKYGDFITYEELQKKAYNHAKPLYNKAAYNTGYGVINAMYYSDKTNNIKGIELTKLADTLDLSSFDKLEKVFSLKPNNSSNKEFMLSTIDEDIIVDRNKVYPFLNNGSTVTKKLYSRSNLNLWNSIDIKMPNNKLFEEINNNLIFKLSGKRKDFNNEVDSNPLQVRGTVVRENGVIKFKTVDSALVLNNFNMPDKITIQVLVKNSSLSTLLYPLSMYNTANTKEKIIFGYGYFKSNDKTSFVTQFGTTLGNLIPNLAASANLDKYNVVTLQLNFNNGDIIYQINGTNIFKWKLDNIKSKITSTSQNDAVYFDNSLTLKNINQIIVGNNSSISKASSDLELYDIRIFDRILTREEVLKNTSALICNAQINDAGGNNMEYKGSVTLISGLKQANGGKFPLVDGSAVQYKQEEKNGNFKSIVDKIEELESGEATEWATTDDVDSLLNSLFE